MIYYSVHRIIMHYLLLWMSEARSPKPPEGVIQEKHENMTLIARAPTILAFSRTAQCHSQLWLKPSDQAA